MREAYGSLENLVARFAVEAHCAGGDSSNRIGSNEADGVSPFNPITADTEQVAGLKRTMGRNIGTITAPVRRREGREDGAVGREPPLFARVRRRRRVRGEHKVPGRAARTGAVQWNDA